MPLVSVRSAVLCAGSEFLSAEGSLQTLTELLPVEDWPSELKQILGNGTHSEWCY